MRISNRHYELFNALADYLACLSCDRHRFVDSIIILSINFLIQPVEIARSSLDTGIPKRRNHSPIRNSENSRWYIIPAPPSLASLSNFLSLSFHNPPIPTLLPPPRNRPNNRIPNQHQRIPHTRPLLPPLPLPLTRMVVMVMVALPFAARATRIRVVPRTRVVAMMAAMAAIRALGALA